MAQTSSAAWSSISLPLLLNHGLVVQVLEPDRIHLYDVAAGGGGAEEVQDRPDIT